ncbi:hypothetical protein TI39_contig620g00003 [Zymoseptoria brevis]|uniref:Uncharacterized protein n=1 Tax=Zymoseptoria brevis TaxID=1047168 RepID=A0A0F4GGC8_9PEZI|nr:hypothetical protein TI39_contig620g00003 [Zymoseptoria brevis]
MTPITSSSCNNPPDRPSGTKRKADIALLPDEDCNFDHDDKHPGTIPCAVDREWISPRQSNKRARHSLVSATSHAAIGLSDEVPPPVANTKPSSPPRLVIQQPLRFDGDVNNEIDHAGPSTPSLPAARPLHAMSSPSSTLLLHISAPTTIKKEPTTPPDLYLSYLSSPDPLVGSSPAHYPQVRHEAAPPPTPPLPSPHPFQADPSSASESHHHQYPATPAPISYFSSSSSPDPIVGPSPNRPVAQIPSTRSGSGHAEGMGPASASAMQIYGGQGASGGI